MIRFRGVSKTYAGAGGAAVHALRGLELEVAAGETLCLIGTSGCGKTTTLRLVNRLLEPTAGRVEVEGRDVAALEPVALRRGIGYVVQEGGLFPHLTVARNVGLLGALEGWSAERVERRVHELLERVALPAARFAQRFPCELSGGQRQRVGVARALFLDPPVLLMDEPFGALDPITRREVRGEVGVLARDAGRTVILVTHDLEEAFELGDRIGLMDAGSLLQVGTPEELRERPANDTVRRFVAAQLHAV